MESCLTLLILLAVVGVIFLLFIRPGPARQWGGAVAETAESTTELFGEERRPILAARDFLIKSGNVGTPTRIDDLWAFRYILPAMAGVGAEGDFTAFRTNLVNDPWITVMPGRTEGSAEVRYGSQPIANTATTLIFPINTGSNTMTVDLARGTVAVGPESPFTAPLKNVASRLLFEQLESQARGLIAPQIFSEGLVGSSSELARRCTAVCQAAFG